MRKFDFSTYFQQHFSKICSYWDWVLNCFKLQTPIPAIFSQAVTENLIRQSIDNQIVNSEQIPTNQLLVPGELLLKRLSYTHLVQLMPIGNLMKRSLYEVECIKGNWSVSALKGQIHSLLYERTGLSHKPEQLVSRIEDMSPISRPMDIIKSVYAFTGIFTGMQGN